MIRIVLQNIILFLLPSVLYIVFMLVRRREQTYAGALKMLDNAPVGWLIGAGAALMIAGLAYFGSETGGRPGETYQPPVYRDGKIIPGQRK